MFVSQKNAIGEQFVSRVYIFRCWGVTKSVFDFFHEVVPVCFPVVYECLVIGWESEVLIWC